MNLKGISWQVGSYCCNIAHIRIFVHGGLTATHCDAALCTRPSADTMAELKR